MMKSSFRITCTCLSGLLKMDKRGKVLSKFFPTASIHSNGPHHEKTHFGYEEVSVEEKSSKVNRVFSNVADKYDLMNDLMSGGIHRIWKACFINKLDPLPGTQLLDVAGGTGDIAFKFIDRMRTRYPHDSSYKVTVCDINHEMLERGKKKAISLSYDDPRVLDWKQGDAQNLPFPDNSFDAYTIAFGIRNVVNIDEALRESYRVLKPGGIFMCLEFSKVNTPGLSQAYDWYSFNIIPVLGELIAGDWRSYKYLVESIRKFPDQRDFAEMIRTAGFHLVEYQNMTQGIATIHWGYKENSSRTPEDDN
ncbi:ubiquinone biosynthesis protein COQ3, mitochondrial [Brevipalpus obovatus]|uniref:ubiquinone biosynthesis protein COQ3, mitochondrial n=1 Tax=Brevipalpus obovatus TaxID=246614 RepID=UPI003D9E384E